jgi:hypothetical protein
VSTKPNPKSKSLADVSLLVDLHGAANILGIAPSSVRTLIRQHALPELRAGRGGKIFVPRAELSRLISGLAKRRHRPHRAARKGAR